MNTYTPDTWNILKIKSEEGGTFYKVFGSWSGGYLDGDSWRMNSGIERVEETEDKLFFYGYSGSVYEVYKQAEGVRGAYGLSVLTRFLEQDGVECVNWSDVKEELLCLK